MAADGAGMARSRLVRAFAVMVTLLVAATGCGASEPVADGPFVAAAAAAEVNEGQLTLTNELDTTEMLDVRTGAISSLDDVVTGDRAVLVWYWAPD